MDVFALFDNTSYTFLELSSGVGGNRVVNTWTGEGIVRLREGMTQADNVESHESNSTVHIKTSEPFIATLDGSLVGHGIRIANGTGDGQDYRIVGQSLPIDYEDGSNPFYKLTLKKESLWDSSELPAQ